MFDIPCLSTKRQNQNKNSNTSIQKFPYKLIYNFEQYDSLIKPALKKIADGKYQSIAYILKTLNRFNKLTSKFKFQWKQQQNKIDVTALYNTFKYQQLFQIFWKNAAQYILKMQENFKVSQQHIDQLKHYRPQLQKCYSSYSEKQLKKELQKLSNKMVDQRQNDLHQQKIKFLNEKLNIPPMKEFQTKNNKVIPQSSDKPLNKLKQKTQKKFIQIIKNQQEKAYEISKQDILLLMCLMSFNLTLRHEKKFPLLPNASGNFSYIFARDIYKSKCIMIYFEKAFSQSYLYTSGFVKVHRQVTSITINSLIAQNQNKKLCKLTIKADTTDMQDLEFKSQIKVDFANKDFGGGSLGGGSVQQEIMIANRPQLYTIMLLCQTLDYNESLSLVGFKKFTKNQGYSYNVKYGGQQKIDYGFDINNYVNDNITVIDALHFSSYDNSEQFSQRSINREIMKAYTGFLYKINPKLKKIVSGNWGCGAFNGDLKLKLLIQWIAASLAGKELIYCPYGKRSQIDYEHVIKYFRNQNKNQIKTIKEAYQLVIKCAQKVKNNRRFDNLGIFGKIWEQYEHKIYQEQKQAQQKKRKQLEKWKKQEEQRRKKNQQTIKQNNKRAKNQKKNSNIWDNNQIDQNQSENKQKNKLKKSTDDSDSDNTNKKTQNKKNEAKSQDLLQLEFKNKENMQNKTVEESHANGNNKRNNSSQNPQIVQTNNVNASVMNKTQNQKRQSDMNKVNGVNN